ncbi:MAG: hypothetical protein ACLR0N_09405 [Bilophila wadsworthia]
MPLPQIRIVFPLSGNGKDRSGCHRGHPRRGRIDNRIITATVDRLDLSELHDYDAIIARGYSAAAEAQGLGVPVIDIAISGYDIIVPFRMPTAVSNAAHRLSAFCFNGIEQFPACSAATSRLHPRMRGGDPARAGTGKQDGCDVIVSGYSCSRTRAFWATAILLRTGGKPTRSRWRAIRTVTLVQRERIGRKPIKSY